MLLEVDNDATLPTDCAPLPIVWTVIGDRKPGGGPSCIVAVVLLIPDVNAVDDEC